MIEIRIARREDAPILAEFICGLADYEKLRKECFVKVEKLEKTLFGPRPAAEALLAFKDEEPAGFALFFHNYSTFLAQPGLYLEDLFVKPEFRRSGIGGALFKRLGQIAVERDCGRFEWSVLDWNSPAIEFYKKMGAQAMTEWTVFRLTGEPLRRLGAKSL